MLKGKLSKLLIFLLIFLAAALIILIIDSSEWGDNGYSEIFDGDDFYLEELITGLDTVWAIDFLPNGNMIFTERAGKVSVYDGDDVEMVGEVEVSERSESGLHGVAVDPDFTKNKFIYLYYTTSTGNRVSRFVFNEKLEDEKALLEGIPSARFHDGGRIKFGFDEYLYVTTGDATNPNDAQDINSLAGKILRMDRNGNVVDGNPFGNFVYSYGHRNPQGIDWLDEQLYAAEHGQSRNDEVNRIEIGGNYGWPEEECDSRVFKGAVRCFSEFTLAPSGMAFHNGDLYLAGLRGNQIRKLAFEDGRIVNEKKVFDNYGRIREVVSYNEWLYFATSNKDGRGVIREDDDKIVRVRFNDN
jgi:aldose sugar dehydrogenase